jgi:6-phosphofructokinase 1
MTVGEVVHDSPDQIRLGGVAAMLKQQLSSIIRSEIRHSVLGHIQRGGTPTAFDRNLATLYGSYAAAMVAAKQFGRMVALQQNRVTSIALADVANRTRTVPPDSPMIASALAVGTSFGVSDFDLRLNGSQMTHAIS